MENAKHFLSQQLKKYKMIKFKFIFVQDFNMYQMLLMLKRIQQDSPIVYAMYIEKRDIK